MKRKKHIYIILILVFGLASVSLLAQGTKKLVREGNNQYDEGNFSDAEVQYRKALTDDPNYFKGKFNLGDAMYSQENYEEAGKIFNELAERALETEQKSDVYYNLGNTLLSAQKYKEAIEAYKRSLRLNPNDYDSKYNLEYARKKLSDQQQQQQNQDQNQDKDKQDQDKQDQENKDKNKDDQQKDQEQKEQDQKDQQDKQNQDKNDQSEQKQQQQQPQQISKEDAQKMLDALKNDEKKTLQELQKQKAKAAKGSKSEIDW